MRKQEARVDVRIIVVVTYKCKGLVSVSHLAVSAAHRLIGLSVSNERYSLLCEEKT